MIAQVAAAVLLPLVLGESAKLAVFLFILVGLPASYLALFIYILLAEHTTPLPTWGAWIVFAILTALGNLSFWRWRARRSPPRTL